MARLIGQSIDSSVHMYTSIYLDGGVWYTSSISNPPDGFYIGENVVITSDSNTDHPSLVFHVKFKGETVGIFDDNIIINSDAVSTPNQIHVTATCVESFLSLPEACIDFGDVIIKKEKCGIFTITNNSKTCISVRLEAPDGFWFTDPVTENLVKELIIELCDGDEYEGIITNNDEFLLDFDGNTFSISGYTN